ncbi:MAG TPA: MtrAB system histidine kinase MtrB [Mycobacteriales bacterium]|nr:MtrAB system histidine kinase MtrB [Mycobacteriales bacterium]
MSGGLRVIHRVTGLPGAVRRRWRRSLSVRVVASTLVLSAGVSLLLGATILAQVRSGLLDSASRSALAQLSSGVGRAQNQFLAQPGSNPRAAEQTAYEVITALSPRPDQDDYDVAMLPSTPGLGSFFSQRADLASIPPALARQVAGQTREAWTFSSVPTNSGAGVPGIVAGAAIPGAGGRYQLYYLFPLTREVSTLRLVERTMILAGIALVAFLAALAALITRQVVRPVRQAASTAERLASGRLEERMTIRGEDDLATLAASFNRMADTVQEQISQLRELSRLQQRFVADVSHELRTPITTIRMAADVLHESSEGLSPELSRSSELLQAQLDRFELLLADLLEISRHDAGAAVLDAEPVDLTSLVSRVVSLASPLATRRGCALSVDVPTDPVIVEVDSRRIERVLRNLVDNAIEHSEGQPVDVRLRGAEGGVAIAVSDRGVGLRPGEAALVFGRFWRADPARARTTGGTGLGLSIALEDVRLHGGWLQAWGQPGQGSVFRVTLAWHPGERIESSPLPLGPAEATVQEAPSAQETTTAAETTSAADATTAAKPGRAPESTRA